MLRPAILLLATLTLAGCFLESSFPAVESRLKLLRPEQVQRLSTRAWAARVQQEISPLLPPEAQDALTTESLADPQGTPVDVYTRLGVNRATVDNLLCNLAGLQHTAQISSPEPSDKTPAPAWPDFTNVEIPLRDGGTLCARLAAPTARPIPGSYVVITHGLFGAMNSQDMRNHLDALRAGGHSVLALEMRGHGDTRVKYPALPVTFGAAETLDLLEVAHWLKRTHRAARVGLVSFSLTGYESILAACLEGDPATFAAVGNGLLAGRLAALGPAPAYNGGMFIVSPPANFRETGDLFDAPFNLLTGPTKAFFQAKCSERLAARGETPSHRMWDFAASEYRRSPLAQKIPTFDAFRQDFLAVADLQARDWSVGRARLEKVRANMLVLASANDPLGTAHGVGHLFAGVTNPHVAVILLPQGGHMGFPALSADYYYSLLRNFFDPNTGPR